MFLPVYVEAEYSETRQHAPAVYLLIAITVLVHAWLFLVIEDSLRTHYYYSYGVVRLDYKWWSALTCVLLHGSWLHLLGNMYFLWIYGRSVERLLGSLQFLVTYVVGAFISVNIHVATVSPLYNDQPAVGASGAISAVLGAFLVLLPTAKLRTLYFDIISFRPLMIELPAFVVLSMWFIGQLLAGLNVFGHGGGIAFWAHIGGFAAGAATGTIQGFRKRRKEFLGFQQLRDLLLSGWAGVQSGDFAVAGSVARDLDGYTVQGAQGLQPLLTGVTSFFGAGRRDAARDAMVRAFNQTRDYQDYPKQLTVYFQLLKCCGENHVPGWIHCDAGIAAAGLKQPQLALWSYEQAIRLGADERLEQVLTSIEGIARNKLQQPHAADLVAAEIAQVRSMSATPTDRGDQTASSEIDGVAG